MASNSESLSIDRSALGIGGLYGLVVMTLERILRDLERFIASVGENVPDEVYLFTQLPANILGTVHNCQRPNECTRHTIFKTPSPPDKKCRYQHF